MRNKDYLLVGIQSVYGYGKKDRIFKFYFAKTEKLSHKPTKEYWYSEITGHYLAE